MEPGPDHTLSNSKLGTHGNPADTPGYPNDETEDLESFDLERFLEPREAAKLMTADQPIAHDGKAGWAVERETGRAIWLSGTPQYEVMSRSPRAVRDEPGLTDLPTTEASRIQGRKRRGFSGKPPTRNASECRSG